MTDKKMNTADEQAASDYYTLLGTYIRELNKAHKGIRRLVRRNRKLEAENYDFRHNKIKIVSFHDPKDRIISEQFALVEQLVRDLNSAHDEIMTLQGLDPKTHDWPEWTTQANSIRAAERMLMKRLAKTDAWSEFPDKACEWLADRRTTRMTDTLNPEQRKRVAEAVKPELTWCIDRGGPSGPFLRARLYGPWNPACDDSEWKALVTWLLSNCREQGDLTDLMSAVDAILESADAAERMTYEILEAKDD